LSHIALGLLGSNGIRMNFMLTLQNVEYRKERQELNLDTLC
jgi:hypothetical protein